MGFYQQAKKILEKILKNPEKLSNLHNHAPQDISIARILRSLGLIYLHENNYPKSKEYFEKSLELYAKHYGKEHIEYAMTLADYSQFYIRKKDYKVADQMIAEALTVLQKHKHPEQYKCHEYRGDLYAAEGKIKKAQEAYLRALTIAKQHFPKNSAHITRLKSKIPFIQRCIVFLRSFF
jgi:tetratricopeptide (TPR) repeat protein